MPSKHLHHGLHACHALPSIAVKLGLGAVALGSVLEPNG